MKKNIPIGVDNFEELVDPAYRHIFVDKSLFIQEILDDSSKVVLITRPRRWGKTLNLSMLQYFLAPRMADKTTDQRSPGPFDHLAIGRVEQGRYLQYQGQHPVIFISFKDIKRNEWSNAISKIGSLLQHVFRQYAEIVIHSSQLNVYDKKLFFQYLEGQVNVDQLQDGLLVLSELLHKHYGGKKIYILIDEYDTPLNYAYSNGYIDNMTEFMRNLLSAALKGNPYLEKGVMTGVLRISKDSMLSGLNNVAVHSVMQSSYAAHFGFNDEEVKTLFKDSGLEQEMTAIRQYYNGYRIGELALYNPWSIMECLKNQGVLQPYWINTADDRLLSDTLLQSASSVKTQLQSLINDAPQPIVQVIDTAISDTIRFEEIVHNETAMWSLLLSTGYLTIVDRDPPLFNKQPQYRLRIPNQEVRNLFVSIFRSWFTARLTQPAYQLFMADLIAGRIETFTHKLEQYLLTYGSYHDFVSESNYHTFMLGLLCGLMDDYWLYSNMEAGHGRADMILIPRDTSQSDAIIIECKRDQDVVPSKATATKAIEQIDARQYQAFIMRHPTIQRILKIGLAFNGKQVASQYRVDPIT